MTTLRSEGWSVRPTFVPGGPTRDLSLWCDEAGLTQIGGDPVVAWQTPWLEIGALQLVRTSRSMSLMATIDAVRYCWRRGSLEDFEAWRDVVLAHGGVVTRQRRRAGVLAVVAIVLLASFGGAIASWFNRGSAKSAELASARAVNLTLEDLPGGWYVSPNPLLANLVPPSSQVIVATPTTLAPKAGTIYAEAENRFQSCLGVSARADRIYGAAGQQPDYQVSSNVYATTTLGGAEVATTTQYYPTTKMVRRDQAEMARANFGSCFATSSAAVVLSGFGLKVPANVSARNWRPATFLHGFARGGVAGLAIPGVATSLQLVTAVVVSGHFEVTVSGITSSWPKAESFFNGVVNTVLSRVTSPSATPA
ncbi:MAG: hypothetical protein KGJ10_00105 [Acidobacteriota bacterium]|nr:hypothetical protein [Acidobacteriota bacterium]MDE3043214.1 hypothetical protein [Acidobacteriota bacterium]MDE3106536.1 hypothetical protein [Acidobacteriota bacterium]MDE3222624.1 hypothetical protein [Acidobacteriota bacterium]